MKKAFLSPLCSAFVIPGLGQVLNGELKKGAAILGGVLLVFVAGVVKLLLIIQRSSSPSTFLDADQVVHGRCETALVILGAMFGVLWLYSVVDAFLKGRLLDTPRSREIP